LISSRNSGPLPRRFAVHLKQDPARVSRCVPPFHHGIPSVGVPRRIYRLNEVFLVPVSVIVLVTFLTPLLPCA
jgi:hypothetical protein